jgi:hypothetical protein
MVCPDMKLAAIYDGSELAENLSALFLRLLRPE